MSRIATTMAEAASQGRRRHRRFALALTGTFFGILGFFVFVNTWINPLWVTPSPWTNEAFAPYRQIYRNTRTAKAGLLRANDWEVVLMGSSRVAIAMDPTLPEWGGRKVLNLGLSASTLQENKCVVDHVLKTKPSVKRLVVGVDLDDIASVGSSMHGVGFFESPFNPDSDATERELRYLFGVSAFRAAVNTWRTRRKEEMPPYTELGHWARHRTHGIERVRDMMVGGTIPGAKRGLAARKVVGGAYPPKLECLKALVRNCRAHGVDLTLLVPPNHVVFLAVSRLGQTEDPFLIKVRLAMADAVREVNAEVLPGPPAKLWDFNDYHPLNAEALPPLEDPTRKMHYWLDGIHAKEPLGAIMLQRMFGWSVRDPAGADYGVRLDLVRSEDLERRMEEQFDRYRAARADDWAWIESKIRASAATVKLDDDE